MAGGELRQKSTMEKIVEQTHKETQDVPFLVPVSQQIMEL